jgi:hypothetical protein
MSHVSVWFADCKLSLSISAAAAGKVKREERTLAKNEYLDCHLRCCVSLETADQGWLAAGSGPTAGV